MNMERELFKNPPITEAIIDIKCDIPRSTNLALLESFQNGIEDIFPDKKERQAWSGEINLTEGNAPELLTPSLAIDGYLFTSPTENKIVQSRIDGFTFNKLKPYSMWNDFSEEAKYLWNRYVKIASPVKVQRIGLRYINNIEIPSVAFNTKDYILTGPELAPGIPSSMSDYFFRVVIPHEEENFSAIITQTIDTTNQQEGKSNIIFDIDVFTNTEFDPNNEDIWIFLEKMHDYKNKIFFCSITEKTKELFL